MEIAIPTSFWFQSLLKVIHPAKPHSTSTKSTMDAKSTEMICLKILIDKQQSRVVFAESGNEFVDVLFSFLTLPMGTIVRLMSKEKPQPAVIGCINSLYKGVEDLDVNHFQTNKHKTDLLEPKNPFQSPCRKLKLNIDDSKPVKYYLCENCYDGSYALLNTYPKGVCKCGALMTKEMYLADDYDGGRDAESTEGVFVKETARFIITDDLRVMPSSLMTVLELFEELGVGDFDELEERMVYVGLDEVSSLLRLSLLSKTALTDLYLPKPLSSAMSVFHSAEQDRRPRTINFLSHTKNITLKLMVRKSDRKVMYAEAEEDFVNYLLVILAIPVGSVVKLMDTYLPLGCISNLYESLEDLNTDKYMKSEDLKAELLSPKLGIQATCQGLAATVYQMTSVADEECEAISASKKSLIFKNLDCPTLETLGEHKIVKGPETYLVTDDLVVTPLFQVSSISILGSLKVPMRDLEVWVVSFGKMEALRLLEASLISKSALTTAFSTPLRKKWLSSKTSI